MPAARRIDVEVEQGGAELIRVVDDGCGIQPDDLPLAFASHATSKLANADDLFRIGTLGFRGEALASIGGVAQVTLQSRPPDQPCGAEITCHGGELSPVRAWNGAPGTRIEVRHLFYNTPVRRKFLRTHGHRDGPHLRGRSRGWPWPSPALHLTLRHNGKHVYEVPASAGLLDRIGLFFGAEVRDQLYPVEAGQGPVALRGYIADPACERGNAKMQYLFVNGRWIRDRSLGHALQEAYRGLLMTGRYAVAFLFLELPPDQVDVNVHPTKAEVRFRDGQALYHLVLATVRERLRAENLTARLQAPAAGRPTQPVDAPAAGGGALADRQSRPPSGHILACRHSAGFRRISRPPGRDACRVPLAGCRTTHHGGRPPLATEKAIQLYDAYLVLETPEGMLVIDQHALHERILFEQLKRRIRAGELETQRLLIPEPVDLPAEQAARTLEHRDALAELGLGVEDFGGGTLLVTSYPAILGNRSPAGHPAGRGGSPGHQGAAAEPRAAAQRPAEPDGLPRRGPGRRPPDAGGDRRPGGPAEPGRRHPPLPARPAHVAAVQPAGAGPAVSARLNLWWQRRRPTGGGAHGATVSTACRAAVTMSGGNLM